MGELFGPLLSEALPGNLTVVVKYAGAGSTKRLTGFNVRKMATDCYVGSSAPPSSHIYWTTLEFVMSTTTGTR